MILDGLLVGFILCLSLVAALFFLKFWRITRDPLFLAFSLGFAIEGLSRLGALLLVQPNDSNPGIYLVRLIGYLIILFSIVQKNKKRSP